MPDSFRRRLTRDAVKTSTILIEKYRWRLFPAPGVELTIEAGGERFRLAIEAEDCACDRRRTSSATCQPAPSQLDFRPGARLTVEKIGANTYRIVPEAPISGSNARD